MQLFSVMSVGATAEQIPLTLIRGEAIQGGLMIFKTDAQNQVWLDEEAQHISPNGYFAIGFHRDDTKSLVLEIISKDGISRLINITPNQREYDIQKIDNLPSSMVTPPAETLNRIKLDIKNVKRARAVLSQQTDAIINGFNWPVWGRITGIYGSQRVLNGQPRQPHYGIDIAAPPGLAVWAAADGIVQMADDLYFTGGTIIIDHGFYLNSTYSHLQTMKVKKGQRIKKGQIIGSVGSTGRSTGPHLDWRINWKQKRLDPLLLAGPLLPAMPAPRPNP